MSQALATSLPVPLTGFVGREQELAEVRRLCERTRVLTLTGAGGSGKTRLALALAQRLADEGCAVAFVELAPLADADALAQHVAHALGIRAEGAASPEQAIIARVQGSEGVLVLDNCEHVVEAAARFVSAILAGCPALKVLATSREALGVGGERSWLIPPLALPPEDAHGLARVGATEAVRLFVERAQDVSRAFELTGENVDSVVRICRRLDGLPLAIELAAARVTVLAPAQIAARLDDRFALLTSGTRGGTPRQRTLRGAVDWSYDLLDEGERILLERLSVFTGGFTLDAAETVCAGGPVPGARLLDLLSALTTKSLVAMHEDAGAARYRLLETIREYARDRRRARGADDGVERRHAEYFLSLAAEAEEELLKGRPARLAQVDVEHDNLLTALQWSAERREGARIGLPMVRRLLWYWFHRQLFREGFSQAERALASADDPGPADRAGALHGMGLFGMYARDPRAGERLAEAQRLWREAGIERWQAFTRLVETVAASLRKDVEAASRHAHDMLAIAQRQPDPWDAALAKAHGLVPVLVWQGQWAEAARLLDEALATYQACDYQIGVAYVLDAQAFVSFMLGDVVRAVRLVGRSLRHDPATENRWLAGRSLRILGAVAERRGDVARALRFFGAADAMYEAIGAASLTAERQAVNRIPARLCESLPREVYQEAWDAGRRMSYRDALALALEEVEREAAPSPGTGDTAPPAEGTAPHSAPTAAPLPPPPGASGPPALEVRALGRLEVRRLGVDVPGEAWGYAKPRELLLYLLAHPEGRTRDQVGLAFWPDIGAAQVKNNFHVTLHHLRRALGDASIVRFERGRYRVAVDGELRFDAARFDAQVTETLRALKDAADDVPAAARLEEALGWYRGGFLDEEPAGDWHLAWRDRLARLHEDGWRALAESHERRGDMAGAADAYRRLIESDPTHEAVARRLMLTLARAGRRTEALTACERLAQAMRRDLDAAPEAETVALAERIRRGPAS